MAYQRLYDRWAPEWRFFADSVSDVSDIEENEPDAPVGSTILAAGSDAPPTEYVKFPSGWAQTGGFQSTSEAR